jgi:hypothetical protein
MSTYVQAMLTRVNSLKQEYGDSLEAARISWLENRSCQCAMQRCQEERDMLMTMLEWWASCPETTFEDRETLETAVVSLKTAGRKAI